MPLREQRISKMLLSRRLKVDSVHILYKRCVVHQLWSIYMYSLVPRPLSENPKGVWVRD